MQGAESRPDRSSDGKNGRGFVAPPDHGLTPVAPLGAKRVVALAVAHVLA